MTGCCVLMFAVRALPPRWLHDLLAALLCRNHLALLTVTFIYSKVYTISIYVHGGNNKKYYHQKLTESMLWVTEMLDGVTFKYITHPKKREQL